MSQEQCHGPVIHGDALQVMTSFERQSVDLILCDPPYSRVKTDAWDRQWKTEADYFTWIGALCEQWARLLKPNGSLYVFASPKMSARVECVVRESFQVLNHIVWYKTGGNRNWSANKEEVRSFLPNTERIIFAEPYGNDSSANEAAGFSEAERVLRKRIFGDPIQEALTATKTSTHELTAAIGAFGTVNHGGAVSNWLNGFNIPLKEYYDAMRVFLNGKTTGNVYLRKEYEDLRKEYEDLRKEYEDLRRPFTVSATVPFTDVWNFPTVASSPYKHICEKPLSLLSHIITCSSRPGALVLDCFAGSGSTGVSAIRNGRQCIGIEQDPVWVRRANEWIASEKQQDVLPFTPAPPVTLTPQPTLFTDL